MLRFLIVGVTRKISFENNCCKRIPNKYKINNLKLRTLSVSNIHINLNNKYKSNN